MLKTNLIFILLAVSFISLKLSAQTSDTIIIYFDINSYSIGSGYFEELDKISASKPEKITILAYTDFLGSVELNKTLSENRAEAVKKYLAKKGISTSIIASCEGKGIHTFSSYENRRNENDRGIKEHRKAEIIITYKPVVTESVVITIPIESDLRNIDSKELVIGKKLILKNINFMGGTPNFLEQSYPVLNDLLALMRENPKLKIAIHGHICCQATDDPDGYDYINKNNTLSLNRAKAVYDFLVDKGIEADRMTYIGLGSKYKLYPNERDEWEQSLNRRVEIIVIENE